MVPLSFLTPEDVYVAYVDDQWIRARLLSVKVAEDSTTATVLAIDYGYSVSVETSQLMRLPPGCRGIPPQVSIYKFICQNFIMKMLLPIYRPSRVNCLEFSHLQPVWHYWRILPVSATT